MDREACHEAFPAFPQAVREYPRVLPYAENRSHCESADWCLGTSRGLLCLHLFHAIHRAIECSLVSSSCASRSITNLWSAVLVSARRRAVKSSFPIPSRIITTLPFTGRLIWIIRPSGITGSLGGRFSRWEKLLRIHVCSRRGLISIHTCHDNWGFLSRCFDRRYGFKDQQCWDSWRVVSFTGCQRFRQCKLS